MGLRIWLPMTGTLENQGLSDLKFSIRNAEYTQTNNSGKIGVCYENTAHNNGGITSDKMIDLGSKQSMCCWINMTDVYSGSSLMGIGGQHRYSANTGMGLTIRYVSATSGYLSVNTGNGSSRTYNTYYGTTLMSTGKWYHVCYTYDGSVVKLYVDGELDATHTVGALSVPAEYVSVFLWSYNHNNYIFSGRINDFRCYDHVLSPAEVKEISKGLVLHYPLNREGFGADNLIIDTLKDRGNSHTTYNVADFNFSEALVSGDTYTVSAKVNASSEKKGICFYHSGGSYQMGSWMPINDAGIYTATFTATDAMASRTGGVGYGYCRVYVSNNASIQGSTPLSGTANIEWIKVEKGSVATPWTPNPADTLYSAMGMDDGIEYDCSGFKNNGQWYAYDSNGSVEFSSDTPRYKISTHIVSDNATTNTASGTRYLYGHCSITEPTEMSVAFWCNPIEGYNSSTGQGQFCTTKYAYGNANVGSDYRDSAMNHRDSTIDINESTSTTQCRPAITFTANEWHHYAVTYDGQTGRVYKDGVQTSTAAFSSEKTLDSFIGVVIGFSKAGGVWRSNNSYYSDFRVYVTALSADDIVDLYQKSASIANNGTVLTYEFEEA